MTNALIMAGQLLLGLSILIILHELGHMIAARIFGIKVEKFFLFFDLWGFKLFSFRMRGCEYGLGWLPLGGYVKIAGMVDESLDTAQLAKPAQPWEYRSKPAWQRLIVMLGGIAVNILLGIFIFWMLVFRFGETYIPNKGLTNGISPGIIGKKLGLQPGDQVLKINGRDIVFFEELNSSRVLLDKSQLTIQRHGAIKTIVTPDNTYNLVSDYGIHEFVEPRVLLGKVMMILPSSNAQKAGIQPRDSIIAIDGIKTRFFDEFQRIIKAKAKKKVRLTIIRDKKTLELVTQVSEKGLIGVSLAYIGVPTQTVYYSFLGSLPVGASRAWGSFMDNVKGLGKVLRGQVKANKAFTGPVGIAKMFGSQVDWIRFWSLVGLLSMALALMNLLPIPALDGGHALFLVIEIIKGKPLSDKFMERAQIVGFCILVALMLFVMGNDILKLFRI